MKNKHKGFKRDFLHTTFWFIAIVLITSNFFVGRIFAGEDTSYDYAPVFQEVLTRIQNEYVEPVPTKELYYGALSGMTDVLDRYSEFLIPKVYDDIAAETEGKFGGVGISIQPDQKGKLSILGVVPDTPAAIAGLKAGDRIAAIDGETTSEKSPDWAKDHLRGEIDTKVSVTIHRWKEIAEGDPEVLEIEITRKSIPYGSLSEVQMLEDKIGYIRMGGFRKESGREVADALLELSERGMKSLVLDMRYNPGGYMEGAVDVCDNFLPKGSLVVFTKDRKEKTYEYKCRVAPVIPEDLPVIILINDRTASGAEIVAGALHDYDRAVLVGTKTFGKGVVQAVIKLENAPEGAALKLTTAYYYTPSGYSITKEGGIKPDVEVTMPEEQRAWVWADMHERNIMYLNGIIEDEDAQKALRKLLYYGDQHMTEEITVPDPNNPDKPITKVRTQENTEDIQLERGMDFLRGYLLLERGKNGNGKK